MTTLRPWINDVCGFPARYEEPSTSLIGATIATRRADALGRLESGELNELADAFVETDKNTLIGAAVVVIELLARGVATASDRSVEDVLRELALAIKTAVPASH